jgi:hypothetical protein
MEKKKSKKSMEILCKQMQDKVDKKGKYKVDNLIVSDEEDNKEEATVSDRDSQPVNNSSAAYNVYPNMGI